MKSFVCVLLGLVGFAVAQQAGYYTAESHPYLSYQNCDLSGCHAQQGAVVLDSNWRWLHSTNGYNNCYSGNTWDTSLCPDPVTCSHNCALDGADYRGTYGITASGSTLELNFVTGSNVGSRVYLMEDNDHYKMFQMINREFSFDVDVSNLPCGLNGALYFVEMQKDGGLSEFTNNNAGAKYGTGYCDAQCPHDLKFINGEANVLDWTTSSNNSNSGSGKYGTCCIEMDVWEANSQAQAYTPHSCSVSGPYRCSGTDCGDDATGQRDDGVCDKDGCDLNTYRMGNKDFYGTGSGFTIDTTQPFTVVTQFVTSNGQDNGFLSEIRRYYVQKGQVFNTPPVNVPQMDGFTAVNSDYCTQEKEAFGNPDTFSARGGMGAMGGALERGMVLVMSLWDDYAARMLWLDSDYPLDESPYTPGVSRGPCSTSTGNPQNIENQSPHSSVKFSNIRFGLINTTFSL